MKRFHLLKKTRQSTEYSCGASCLQTVLSYWGKDLDEKELMLLLGTNPEVGTYPEDIVRVARTLGFEAEVKEKLTLDELERATAEGNPVIILGQAWRSRKDSEAAAADDWENGHYVVVLAVDKDHVYYEDPYIRMGKGFMPRKAFEDHWHNVMGGDLEKGPKQICLGIFIRGEKPAKPRTFKDVDLSSLDFSKIGSLNLIVTQFQGSLLPYDFVTDLRELSESGILRPDAFIFLRKDKDGGIAVMEGGRLQEGEEVMEINVLLAALAELRSSGPEAVRARAQAAAQAAAAGDFGLPAPDIHRIAGKLPPGHSAVIVLFENLWEKKFKAVAAKYDGAIIDQQIIAADTLRTLALSLTED